MAYTSMADVLAAASDRLACGTAEVVLKIHIEGDEQPWEIEGEAMLKSAVEDGNVILAFRAITPPSPRKRARVDADRAGPSVPRQSQARTSQVQHRHPTASPALPSASPATVVAPMALSKSRSYLSSGGESADEGRDSRGAQRSSKRKWTEKEDRFLWTSLDNELKALPPPNPTYDREHRRTVFEKIMQKHPRRFVGRTPVALRSRVANKVLEQRKANKKLPARINALFPLSRSFTSTPVPSTQPSTRTGTIASARDLARQGVEIPMSAETGSGRLTMPVATSSSRAASAPLSLKRPFLGDVVRLRTIDRTSAAMARRSPSSSSGSSSTSDGEEGDEEGNGDTSYENQEAQIARQSVEGPTTLSDGLSPHTPSPEPDLDVQRIAVKTELLDQSLTEVESSRDIEPYETSKVGPTSRSRQTAVKTERTFAFCAPPFQPPSDAAVGAERSLRSRIRDSLLEEPDEVLNATVDLDAWAAGVVELCMNACSDLDTSERPASEEEISFVVFAVLEVVLHQAFAGTRSKHSTRRLACAMGMTFNALHRRFSVFQGFDLLLCRFLRHTLFADGALQSEVSTAMSIACITLVVPVLSYESVLDGIFSVPWFKDAHGRSASSTNRMDGDRSRILFARTAAFVECLETMCAFVCCQDRPLQLFRQLRRAPRFRVNAWKRMFEELEYGEQETWTEEANVAEMVRIGMLRWNQTVVKEHDGTAPAKSTLGGVSARSMDNPPARNTRSNKAVLFPSSPQEPLFRGLPDFSQPAMP